MINRTPMIQMAAALYLLGSASAVLAQELEPSVQTSTAAAAVKPTEKPAEKPKAPAPSASVATPSGKSSDRIQLDTTQISGNRELPKVMYVVPWRHADPGDFAGRPPNSLLDEALTPVDRDVFRRQNRYYGVVQEQTKSAASQAGAAGTTPGVSTTKGEK